MVFLIFPNLLPLFCSRVWKTPLFYTPLFYSSEITHIFSLVISFAVDFCCCSSRSIVFAGLSIVPCWPQALVGGGTVPRVRKILSYGMQPMVF